MGEDTTPEANQPVRSYYESPLKPQPDPSGDDAHAVDLLIHERPRILRVKLAVLATQIYERLLLRDHNLERILKESLEVSTQLIPYQERGYGRPDLDEQTRKFWLELQARLNAETRQQEVECWRDVALVMNEFLTVWEGLEQSRVRAEFLREQRQEDAE